MHYMGTLMIAHIRASEGISEYMGITRYARIIYLKIQKVLFEILRQGVDIKVVHPEKSHGFRDLI